VLDSQPTLAQAAISDQKRVSKILRLQQNYLQPIQFYPVSEQTAHAIPIPALFPGIHNLLVLSLKVSNKKADK